MAEAFFVNSTKNHTAFSAGTHVRPEREGQSISIVTDEVTKCMREVGLEVNDKQMNQLTPEMVEKADKVVAITPKETLPDYLQSSQKLEIWDVPDAAGTDAVFHAGVRDMVKAHVDSLLETLNRQISRPPAKNHLWQN